MPRLQIVPDPRAYGIARASLAPSRCAGTMTIPNFITLVRFALVPVMAYFLVTGEYGIALLVFLAAAISDFLDGFIARRFHATSKLGATLDPIADKLSMFVATVLLAYVTLLPVWLAVAIIARDVLIVVGALAYRSWIGELEMTPTFLSKVNTAVEFGVLLLVMAAGAGWLDSGAWLPVVFTVVFATVLASGAQYVWIWGRKAMLERRRSRS